MTHLGSETLASHDTPRAQHTLRRGSTVAGGAHTARASHRERSTGGPRGPVGEKPCSISNALKYVWTRRVAPSTRRPPSSCGLGRTGARWNSNPPWRRLRCRPQSCVTNTEASCTRQCTAQSMCARVNCTRTRTHRGGSGPASTGAGQGRITIAQIAKCCKFTVERGVLPVSACASADSMNRPRRPTRAASTRAKSAASAASRARHDVSRVRTMAFRVTASVVATAPAMSAKRAWKSVAVGHGAPSNANPPSSGGVAPVPWLPPNGSEARDSARNGFHRYQVILRRWCGQSTGPNLNPAATARRMNGGGGHGGGGASGGVSWPMCGPFRGCVV